MNKIQDVSYIHRQTGESLSVCKRVYEKNGCDVELTLRELYRSAKETAVVKEKVDVSYYKEDFEKREKKRKTTKIAVKIILTVIIVALMVFLFYRAVTLVNPVWLVFFILPIALLSLILLKTWLPAKAWKAFQSFGGSGNTGDNCQRSNNEDVDCCVRGNDCDEEPQSDRREETIFDILFNDKKDDDSSKKADEEEWEESCENCGEYYDDCECDDCGDEDCENW